MHHVRSGSCSTSPSNAPLKCKPGLVGVFTCTAGVAFPLDYEFVPVLRADFFSGRYPGRVHTGQIGARREDSLLSRVRSETFTTLRMCAAQRVCGCRQWIATANHQRRPVRPPRCILRAGTCRSYSRS